MSDCGCHHEAKNAQERRVLRIALVLNAAMAVIGSQPGTINYPRLVRSATRCDYTTFEHMTFTISDTGFRMYLSSYVPELLGAQIGSFVDDLLAGAGLTRSDVTHWGIHPGGVPIIDHVQRSLDLTDAQVAVSHHILNEFGNMSSATILFVLDYIQRCNKPQPHDYGVLMAFGPGLTMEGLLVQW